MKPLHDEALWEAVKKRDRTYDGTFFFGVRTTGIFCRPGCPSPLPKRQNVVFSSSPSTLLQAGFRPCRRCRPEEASRLDGSVKTVVSLCRLIEKSDEVPAMSELAVHAGVSASAVARMFRTALGVTPHEYADALRRERFRSALRHGADVLEAAYGAGYSSTSRVYEGTHVNLGMTPKVYRNAGLGQRIAYTVAMTPLGYLLVAATDTGVSSVKLGDAPDLLVEELRREFACAELQEGGERLFAWTSQLVDYLNGRLPWPDLPYDVRATAFQRRVWEYLRRIRPGTMEHYGGVAQHLGKPEATRAVARACATNPVALVIPCHRVVPKGKGLAGYRWGVERKRKLLELENVTRPDH